MGVLEAPQDKYGQEHRTGTSRVEQTDKDHGGAGSSGGHGGAGSSGGHGGAGSSGGHGGAGSSGGHGGAGISGGHGGAGSSGGHGGAGSSGGQGGAGSFGGHGRWSSGALASVPSARPLQPEPLLPSPKISLGKSGGIRSPPGLDTQNSTGQPSRARQTGQDSPQEPLPPPRQGGRRLEWPPWPQQEEPPAPDESPWTMT